MGGSKAMTMVEYSFPLDAFLMLLLRLELKFHISSDCKPLKC